MNTLRRVFAALAATERDRALARQITAYPATTSSAMIVLPASVPTTARADLTVPATTAPAASTRPTFPRLGLTFN